MLLFYLDKTANIIHTESGLFILSLILKSTLRPLSYYIFCLETNLPENLEKLSKLSETVNVWEEGMSKLLLLHIKILCKNTKFYQ